MVSAIMCRCSFLIVFLTAELLLLSNSGVAADMHLPKNFFGGDMHEDFLVWFNERGNEYHAHAFLPSASNPSKGASIHWTVDDTHISLAVAARASGWLGFGLAEAGGMEGADMLLFEASKPGEVRDAYVLDELMPLDDDCNNWEFVASRVEEDSDFIMVEVRRLLDTGDPQDRKIINDGSLEFPVTRVIAAWSDYETLQYHGPTSRTRAAVRWYGDSVADGSTFNALMETEADGFFEMRANSALIPAKETYYHEVCFTWNDLLAMVSLLSSMAHVIGALAENGLTC
jgi:hypothetical protein